MLIYFYSYNKSDVVMLLILWMLLLTKNELYEHQKLGHPWSGLERDWVHALPRKALRK